VLLPQPWRNNTPPTDRRFYRAWSPALYGGYGLKEHFDATARRLSSDHLKEKLGKGKWRAKAAW
jgi:hypothetical protein